MSPIRCFADRVIPLELVNYKTRPNMVFQVLVIQFERIVVAILGGHQDHQVEIISGPF